MSIDIVVKVQGAEEAVIGITPDSEHTFEVSDLGEFMVEGRSGWETMYRLIHKASGRKTSWTLYERAMMLVDQDGDHRICVSPYYTEFDDFKMFTPVEALQYLCAVKAELSVPGPVGLEDESGLEAEPLDDDIPGTE